MIGDAVAIEVPETVSERDVGRMLGACEAALGDDQCVLSQEASGQPWHAFVTRSDESDLAIELFQAQGERPVLVRLLSFEADEPEAFRWQSVGVVVAALVLARDAPRPAHSEAAVTGAGGSEVTGSQVADSQAAVADTSPPETAQPRPAPERLAPPPVLNELSRPGPTLELAPLLAASTSQSAVAGGIWLAGALPLGGPLLAVAQVDVAASSSRGQEFELRGLSGAGSLGIGARWPTAPTHPWQFDVTARAAMQVLSLRAETDAGADTATTVRWGGRAGASASWFFVPSLAAVAGTDLGVHWPPLDLAVADQPPVRLSAFVWGAYLGLRLRLKVPESLMKDR